MYSTCFKQKSAQTAFVSRRLCANGRKRNALLVDDAPMNIVVLKKMLGNIGDFNFVCANNGREALECLKEGEETGNRFDVVFTDIWMPKMDGREFVSHVRANSDYSGVLVYSLTTDVDVHSKCDEFGFDGGCLKPYALNDLRDMLSGCDKERI